MSDESVGIACSGNEGSVGVPCDDFCIRIVRTMTLTLAVVFLAILAGGMYDLSADVARILEAPD